VVDLFWRGWWGHGCIGIVVLVFFEEFDLGVTAGGRREDDDDEGPEIGREEKDDDEEDAEIEPDEREESWLLMNVRGSLVDFR
jgi:hypothetical protein